MCRNWFVSVSVFVFMFFFIFFVFVFHSIWMKMIAPCCCLLNWDLPVPPRWRSGCQAPWGRTASPRPRPRPSRWRPAPRWSPASTTTCLLWPPLCWRSSFLRKRTGCCNGPSTPWWPTHFKMFIFHFLIFTIILRLMTFDLKLRMALMYRKTVISYFTDCPIWSKYESKIELKTSICLIDFPFRGQGLIFLDQYMSESDSGLQPGLDIRKWSGRYLHSPHPYHHNHSLCNATIISGDWSSMM